MSNNVIDVLKIGDNEYTKIKYNVDQASELAGIYVSYISSGDAYKIENLYANALKSVSVNGKPLSDDAIRNEHFLAFPGEMREVKVWAFFEGLSPFLSSYVEKPDLELKYLGLKTTAESAHI